MLAMLKYIIDNKTKTKMTTRRANQGDLMHIIDLHNNLNLDNTFTDGTLYYVLIAGTQYVAIVENKIVGYISVNPLLVSQLCDKITNCLKNICDDSEIIDSVDLVNSVDSANSIKIKQEYFYIIPFMGIMSEHQSLLPELLTRAIRFCTRDIYFDTRCLTIFVRKNNIECQNICMSKGFVCSNFVEENMFNNPKDDGILMYKKINIFNKFYNSSDF